MAGLLKSLLQGDRVLRVFAMGRLPHVVAIELFGLAGGYDAVWFDQEHGGLTVREIVPLALAARANQLGCFVRMPFIHYSHATQNLESGVDGVMAARIQSLSEARQFVDWCKFAPRGQRGINTSGADGHYTARTAAELATAANRDNVVGLQIETKGALDDVDRIAALPEVDFLFVGPSDLSAELGHLGEPEHSDVWDAICRVADACRNHGKPWGIVPAGPDHAARCVELGCRMVTVGSDVAAMRLGLVSLKQSYRALFS